jgi:hypothetical protein
MKIRRLAKIADQGARQKGRAMFQGPDKNRNIILGVVVVVVVILAIIYFYTSGGQLPRL